MIKKNFYNFFCFAIILVLIEIHNVHTKDNIIKDVTISAVGDVMMAGSMLPVIKKNGSLYPFENTKEHLQNSDIAICNLEAPFGKEGIPFGKKFTFIVPPEYSIGLKEAGFDVVSLANNHIMDYGVNPMVYTMSLLDSLGIAYSGAGMNIDEARKPAILLRNGIKVAFLSYSMVYPKEFWATDKKPGTARGIKSHIAMDIKNAKEKSDLVVVSFHWGEELMKTPKNYQKEFARLCIDYGANLVLGHHPHVLQGLEIYKGNLIAYSLGNFAFGSRSKHCTESIILKVKLSPEGLKEVNIIPISVDNDKVYYQPTIVYDDEAIKILKNLLNLSKNLGFEFEIKDNIGIFNPN